MRVSFQKLDGFEWQSDEQIVAALLNLYGQRLLSRFSRPVENFAGESTVDLRLWYTFAPLRETMSIP
jgi:hypothetical protein